MRYALLVVAAGVLFGTTGTTRALAPAGASSLSVGAIRLAAGGLLLGVIGLVAHLRRPYPRATPVITRPTLREALVVVTCAACIMAYQATFFEGTRQNGVMVGTMVALGSSPLFAGLIEWLVLHHRPRLAWVAATVVSVAGVVALSATPGTGTQSVSLLGIGDSLVAGASFAGLAVGAKWLLQRGWHPLDVAATAMTTGALMAVVTLIGTDLTWLATPRGVAVAAWLALGTMVAAYALNLTGLAGTSAATATTLNLTEPATATVLGMIVLGEAMTPLRGLGIAAVIVGVLILAVTARREEYAETTGPNVA
ncbi:MAG: DMT family transporter [Propionibacteriaceae bacterium]|nr:DMT family transporter [Propionibacteriaceae bacterium]